MTLAGDVAPPVIGLERLHFGSVLIVEDVGRSVADILRGSPTLAEKWDIALAMARAVARLHEKGLIHRAISPTNALAADTRDRVWLADFETAVRAAGVERGQRLPTLSDIDTAFMSPEETGRLRHAVDTRSDLYSLGVCLYVIFSGRLPFSSDDPIALIHAHMSEVPPPVSAAAPDVPKALDPIVAFLLRKSPEERYQTASALAEDLIDARKAPDDGRFRPRRVDPARIERRQARLVGRQAEFDALKAAYERVRQGPSELVWLTGRSGLGKTALVAHFRKWSAQGTEGAGWSLGGKFDQYNRGRPLVGLGRALDQLSGGIAAQPERDQSRVIARIRTAVGPELVLLYGLAPSFEVLLGPAPALPVLPPDRAEKRFAEFVSRLVSAIAEPGRPLVLFFDDIQWADRYSLRLLEKLIGSCDGCLVIAAYRDDEIGPAHSLSGIIRNFEARKLRARTLRLEPFPVETTEDYLHGIFPLSPATLRKISETVQTRTGGNPFFVAQIAERMAEDPELAVPGLSEAQFLERLNAKAVTGGVVDFLSKRIAALSDTAQALLALAAGVGDRFTVSDLLLVWDGPEGALSDAMLEALSAGLLVPAGSRPAPGKDVQAAMFRFLHDKVQEAAQAHLDAAARADLHLRCAERLMSSLTPDQIAERVFEIASHVTASREGARFAALGGAERLKAAQLVLDAGLKAKSGGALAEAAGFLATGVELIEAVAWAAAPRLSFDLYLAAAEIRGTLGQFAEAGRLLDIALRHAEDPLERAALYLRLAVQAQIQGLNDAAIAHVATALPVLGVSVPQEPEEIEAELRSAVAAVLAFIEDRGASAIVDLPPCRDGAVLAAMRLLQIQFYAGWRGGRTKLALLGLARIAQLTVERGRTEMSPFGIVGFGMLLVVELGEYALAAKVGEAAIRISREVDDPAVSGMTHYLFAADVMGWSRPLRETLPIYDLALRDGRAAADNLTVGFMMQQSTADRLAIGENLEELGFACAEYAAYLESIGNIDNLNALRIGVAQVVANLTGETGGSLDLDTRDFSEAEFMSRYANAPYHLAWRAVTRMRLAIIWNETAAFEALVGDLALIEKKIPSHANKLPIACLCAGMMHVALAGDDAGRERHMTKAGDLLARLRDWAAACPENVESQATLLAAAMAARNGDDSDAASLFDKAIDGAIATGQWPIAAIASEAAAAHARRTGDEERAQNAIASARDAYGNWGASAKVAQIERDWPALRANRVAPNGCAGPLLATAGDLAQSLDVRAALRATRMLSSAQSTDTLAEQICTIMCENSSAERCDLLARGPEGWEPLAVSVGVSQADLALARFVAHRGAPLLLDDGHALPDELSHLGDAPRGSTLYVPSVNDGEVIAVIRLFSSIPGGVFGTDGTAMLNFLACQAAISLRNRQLISELEDQARQLETTVAERTRALREANDALRALASTDGLTGIPNRRYFDETLRDAAWSSGVPVGIVMIDIDHFKPYNDHYGHLGGDETLIAVARALREAIADLDGFVARFGGEEFAVALRNVDRESLEMIAAHLRDTIDRLALPHAKSPTGRVTISLGAIHADDLRPSDTERLVAKADGALYAAKAAGRNMVRMADSFA
jgi:diguanylate cyclase (GGDEF)-like protein